MNVAFFASPNERGVSVAVFDYAHFNEILLGNKSLIFAHLSQRELLPMMRFSERFEVCYYSNDDEVCELLKHHKVDASYHLIHGRKSIGHPGFRIPEGCKQLVHCVFSTKDPCGDVHASISHYLNKKCGTDCPVVPHMIHLPDVEGDLRMDLGIPADSTVFGRYGGRDTFSVKLAWELIPELVHKDPNLYFIFMNTDEFCDPHPQIIHLPASFDLEEKVRFINTCDAMLHARRDGETFGIAVGEFSIKNKPILTFAPPSSGGRRLLYLLAQSFKSITKLGQRLPSRTAIEHIGILKKKALVYSSKRELRALIVNFDLRAARAGNWDVYSERYCPKRVMEDFKRYFLS